jgi:ABC-2 type transport system permease protein
MTAVAYALRLGRWGVIGFGMIAFISTLVQAAGFYQVAGDTPAERAAFGHQMTALASRFSVLLAPPVRPDTVGGYVQYRSFGGLAILFAVWALVSAAGAARGDEERGLTEAVLATGLTRFAMISSRMGAFAMGTFVAALAAGPGLMIGAASGGESFQIGPVVAVGADLAALALCCYSLCMFVVQLTPARIATATAGVVLVALFLLNSVGRTLSWLAPLRGLSPFHYYELSQPLAPGGQLDARAMSVLVAAALIAALAAALAFSRRDLGSPLIRLSIVSRAPGHDVTRVVWWRAPVARDLYEHRLALAGWTVGMAALAVVLVALTRSLVQPLLSIPGIARFFPAFVNGAVYESFLGFFWFATAQLLFAAFAIAQVARWSAEDSEGRLQLVLSQPRSRASVVVERAAVVAVGAAVIAAGSALAVGYASHAQGFELDRARLAAASLLLVPFTLVFAGAGSLLAAWNPRVAVGLVGAFAFASYLDTEVGPFFHWPDWAQDLSAFKLFGTPLADGIDGLGLVLMLLIALVGFGGSILALQRRDVGS